MIKKIRKRYIFFNEYDERAFKQLTIQSKYEVHLIKQNQAFFLINKISKVKIPKNINYKEIGGFVK